MEDIDFIIKGEQIPVPGLGTYLLSGTACVETVDKALGIGYRLIDTAQDYDNESEVGLAINRSFVHRKDIFLISKIAPGNFQFEDVLKSIDESLKKLETEYIDLMLLHWPGTDVPLKETLDALNEAKRKEKIRYLGLSNFPPALVNEALQYADIFANEVEYHPYLVREYLKNHAIDNEYLTIAYSPAAKSRIMDDSILREIGKNHNKSPVQLALRWLLQEGLVPIPKASSLKHLEENMNIFNFHLSPDEMAAIRSLDRQMHLDPVSDMADE